MKTLILLNRNLYDGTDVAWNALRLIGKLLEQGSELRIFVINDSMDLAKVDPKDFLNITEMLRKLIEKNNIIILNGTIFSFMSVE